MNTPLQDIRILDFTRLLPGPFCTLLLADLGASVIKIESLPGGDYARYLPPTFGDMGGAFAALNRNKKSLAVNLKDPAGIDIIKRLLPACDILVESYRPGVMERFGLGYESLKAIKPELIYCALTGYGQEGAYHRKAGHDLNYLALSGLLSQIGHRKGPPVVPGLQIADITGAYHGVMGILAALIERGRTGMGKFVDVSLTEASASFLVMALGQYATDGKPPRRGIGELNGEIPAYGIYETRDGRYMALGALEPKFWGAFLKAAGREDLMMEGWESGERATKVKQQVEEIFKSRSQKEWIALLAEHDTCCEPVLAPEEAVNHVAHQARQTFSDLPFPGDGPAKTPRANLFKDSAVAPIMAPVLGAHTHDLLRKAGYSEDEISIFISQGAIVCGKENAL